MALLDIFGVPPGYAGLLSPEEEQRARQQAQMQGLLGLASGFFEAAEPSPVRRGIGASAIRGLMAGQQMAGETYNQALKGMLTAQQIQEMRRKQNIAETLRTLGPSLISEQRTPTTQEIIPSEQGDDVFTRPGRVTGYDINMQMLPALAALGPEGMEYGSNLLKYRESLQPKTTVESIFDPQGREMKVRYTPSTGEYTPLGGAKAEPFVQVDRGNVIELRRPTTGELVGTVSKGVAPTAPSYTMTDYGVLNTKTGQIFQPTDDKGNPITIDQSAKASEGERLSSGFYMRMADASATIKKPLTDAKGNPVTDQNGKIITLEDVASKPEIFAEIVGGIIPNWMGGKAAQEFATSSARQQYEQAQANWISANLRKESGAVINPSEMQEEIRKWFPVVGNSPEVIEQKRKARMVAEESMRSNAGRALRVQSQRNLKVDY